jgi:ABC-type multidrug transport system ATPase subunit
MDALCFTIPTSGLDGQAANNTVRFLRKLAEVGQAVLVTIHQPSADLFAQFDTLLLLAKGGKTVYFGDIGHHARTVKKYFAGHGAPCPREQARQRYLRYRFAIDTLSVLVSIASIDTESIRNRFFTAFPYIP